MDTSTSCKKFRRNSTVCGNGSAQNTGQDLSNDGDEQRQNITQRTTPNKTVIPASTSNLVTILDITTKDVPTMLSASPAASSMSQPLVSGCPLTSSFIALSVVAGVMTVFAVLAVIAALYMRHQQRKMKVTRPRNSEEGMDGTGTYMGLTPVDSGFSVSGAAVENRTYEDIGRPTTDAHQTSTAKGGKRQQSSSGKGSDNKGVRYSLTPEPTTPLDMAKSDTYEEVEFTKTTPVRTSPHGSVPNSNNISNYEETNHVASVNIDDKTETSFSETKHSPGYVSVDCKSDDGIDKENDSEYVINNISLGRNSHREGESVVIPIDKEENEMNAKQNGAAVYVTVNLEESRDCSDGEDDYNNEDKSRKNYDSDRPLMQESNVGQSSKEADRCSRQSKFEIISEQNSGSSTSLNYIQTNCQTPKTDIRFSAVINGRPRAWSERGTVGTGNTYQQLPITTARDEEETNIYQKLNRGVLSQTLSHPL